MTLGQLYTKLETMPEWQLIQNKTAKIMPPAVKEDFQRALGTVIGEAFHAGKDSATAPTPPEPPSTAQLTPSSSADPTSTKDDTEKSDPPPAEAAT